MKIRPYTLTRRNGVISHHSSASGVIARWYYHSGAIISGPEGQRYGVRYLQGHSSAVGADRLRWCQLYELAPHEKLRLKREVLPTYRRLPLEPF